MNLHSYQLRNLIIEVVAERFGHTTFNRRRLMLAVEQRVRQLGLWAPEDDIPSHSKGKKSKGLASIDWEISHLKGSGLDNAGYDQWKLP